MTGERRNKVYNLTNLDPRASGPDKGGEQLLWESFMCTNQLVSQRLLLLVSGYYHECFLRGKCFLAKRIPRVHTKHRKRKVESPETEPNFYKMSVVGASRQPQSNPAAVGAQPTTTAGVLKGNPNQKSDKVAQDSAPGLSSASEGAKLQFPPVQPPGGSPKD